MLLPCRGVLAEACGKTGIFFCGICAVMDGNWDTEGWEGEVIDVLVLYCCGSQPDGACFGVWLGILLGGAAQSTAGNE